MPTDIRYLRERETKEVWINKNDLLEFLMDWVNRTKNPDINKDISEIINQVKTIEHGTKTTTNTGTEKSDV